MKKAILIFAFLIGVVTVKAQKIDSDSMQIANTIEQATWINTPKILELNRSMRDLWSAHMYWTFITVDAYYNDPKGLSAKLASLLQNQKDIGQAIVPYYGQQAGEQLAELLIELIQLHIPVLHATKENNSQALDKAVANWYANAKDIGSFLALANPQNWIAQQTQSVLEMHITHTIDQFVSILKADYTQSLTGFQQALYHKIDLSDILTPGIVNQFPDKF